MRFTTQFKRYLLMQDVEIGILHTGNAIAFPAFFVTLVWMRIFLITSKLKFEDNGSPIGGSVVDLHLKAKGLVELGHEVFVVTAFSNEDRIPCTVPYTVFERRIRRRGLLALQFGIHAILKEFENRSDVFYIDGHMFLYGGGAYRLLGGKIPVVGFFNIRLNLWGDVSGNIEHPSLWKRGKKILRYAIERVIGVPVANHLDALIFNTPHVQKMYRDFGIGRNKPNVVIQDFIETRKLTNRFGITKESMEEHQEKPQQLSLLATGRMLPEKGFELLLRALAKVKDRNRYRLLLSGGGPDKERLQALAKGLGLSETVSFPGWVEKEKLYEFFKEAHIFIFPKWWIEYGSAVLTEAMAFGLPSVIPGGGALEWLTNGSALTFKNDDIDELAGQIERLGEHATLRIELAGKALARAEALDAKALAKRLEEVLMKIVRS